MFLFTYPCFIYFILYYIFRPNENKRPRTLSKLNDTTTWEKRKTKGKIAIQKMVVDLMELYLHRLKQRRPPYPKCSAMEEFAAQFSYTPTVDQKEVLSLKGFCPSIPWVGMVELLGIYPTPIREPNESKVSCMVLN